MPIASLTKLATALVFFETKPDLSGTVTIIESDFPGVSRSKLYPGETIELSDCLHLSLMCSDNAAMMALARSTGLGNREFIGRMNDLAGKLGMDQTHFTDPTGLDAGNLSTAADYIKLLRRAYLNETISTISAKKTYQFAALNRNITHTLYNTNRLLYSRWDVRGGKTGYISQAGYCLALDMYDNTGRRINAVVLGSPSNQFRYRDADRLIAYATHN
ncbi:MAG: D-alanyl-D-alanine carboxypeptidase [candidate division Zixibacteria bacterium]|nr:D-alanyl-D-alanine carboxypeptidase [candidate division Zixibacteria bacterium]